MLKVSLLIQAFDKVTAPVRKIRSAVQGMASGGAKDVAKLGKSVDKLGGSARRLGTAFAFTNIKSRLTGLIRNVRQLAGRAGMKGLEKAAYGAGYAIGRLARGVGGLALKAAGVATAGAGFLGGWITAGVIGTASKFEQFQVILENTEGSAEGARRAMSWVKDFAKTTPYELADVMDAFVALKSYGLDPMDGTLRSLGDAASGMGKQLSQAVEMMADAQTGEFERLKEFGIKAKVSGDQVTFAFVKNGKDMKVSARNSSSEIKKALTGIFDGKFKGMMDRQSRTFAGLWSNLKDSFTNFQTAIADAGIFDWLKGKLQVVMNKVQELARNGTLERWAKKISEWMERAGDKIWNFATQTDWAKLGSDIMSIANAIRSLANAVNAIANGPQMPQWLTNPLGNRIAPGEWFMNELRAVGQRPSARVPRGNGKRGDGSGRLMQPLLRPSPSFGPPMRRQGDGSMLRRTSAEVGGRIDLRIRTDRGMTASVTRAESRNRRVPIDVTRAPLAMA